METLIYSQSVRSTGDNQDLRLASEGGEVAGWEGGRVGRWQGGKVAGGVGVPGLQD